MAKNYSNKNRKRKALIAMLCALSVTCTGLAAACAPTDKEDEPSTAITAKEDNQVLKNGNFEHYDVPDKAIHLIKNVNNWTLGGDTSVKSGIINVADGWDKLTDEGLKETLDYNNDLSSDNEDYVNYNSMRSRDIPYKDVYSAMLDDDKVGDSWINKHDGGYEGYFGIQGNETDGYTWNGKEASKIDGEFYIKDGDGNFTKLIRKELTANPQTHWGEFEANDDGTYSFGGKAAYKDGDGRYYFNEDLETDPVGNVLMLHNAGTDTLNNGLHQYYTSSTVTLEAHTAAEISLWVKTSELRFNKGYQATADEEDKGAYIEVIQSVAGNSIDSFSIKAINTENIIASANGKETTAQNGWVQYTVYINACDFANTTVQLRLGLGGAENNEKVTGYAFFDDVQVKKYRELEGTDTECTYKDHKAEITTNGTSCTLTSEEDDRIFYTDVTTKGNKDLHTHDFRYLIDLASDKGIGNNYSPVVFGISNVEVGLTVEEDSKGVKYAAAEDFSVNGVGKKTQSGLKLPKDLKDKPRPTSDDVITVFDKNHTFNGKYAKLLNNLTGENGAPDGNGNTFVTFSAWGAPYTATISDTAFTVPKASADGKNGYLLVSFWVKTSDMDGGTAATVKIYEYEDAAKKTVNEDSVQTLTIDTTDKTTDFEKDKDIYNGWVQCFAFVKNDVKDDTNTDRTFYIDFSFGTTEITTATSFESGYAAIANLQTLVINEDIYNLASAGDDTAVFSFAKDAAKDEGSKFDEATGTDDINNGIALPNNYKGTNGANVLGSATDKTVNAGLINKDVFGDSSSAMSQTEKERILSSFTDGTLNWENAFGENCYQPLIIINSLRQYAAKANANKDTFNNGKYYTKKADGTFEQVKENATFDENETYYTLTDVANYGFIGSDKTVSSNGREVISVRVKVTGDAEAFIYLVDSDDTENVLSFTTPAYTFRYDEEGNVLDCELDEDWTAAEHRGHIVYTLREDGLYEDKDGKLYANLYNLVKSYKDSKYEHNEFYTRHENNGVVTFEQISYDDLKDGETYYSKDKNNSNQYINADHYLCTTDGTHVYEFIDGKYYYVEITTEGDKTTEVTDKEREINNFDPALVRYPVADRVDEELCVKVTKADCDRLGDNGWVTVNFVVKTGSEDKHYRLELWSGDRNETGVDSSNYKNGAVAFDLFQGTVSETRLAAYEAEIVNAYNRAIIEVNDEINAGKPDGEKVDLFKDLASEKENIRAYENLIAGLDEEYRNKIADKMTGYGYGEGTYKASYYTYTLYDSSSYVPFNATTAGDGETGYNYDPSSFSEQLAYFEFEDTSSNAKNVFVDYSAVDQSIAKNTVDDDDDKGDEEETTNATELGLYISSIVLVVVLLITLVSILVTQHIKNKRKASGAKNSNKNVYRKRDRYVKKLHLVKDELIEPESDGAATSPAEDVTPTDETTDAPAEESIETVEPATDAETGDEADSEDKE